jgi:hypothetical protein
MAAQGSRTLKLSLLADVAEFTKGIKTAGKDTESIGDQFTAFGKKAALAFAAAGAAIGAFAIESIKNAAADEKAQRLLALTIENTTNATAAQIAGVEKYISTTSIAIGVTDDELRPAFARLTRSTKDVEDAQKLLNLALDISSATGKPLEAVANALGKAYDGNLASLGRLGLGIDQSILKSKDFDKVFNTLTNTFGGFADNEAQSAEKAFARIKIATDEVQEQIGAALLPVVQELTTFILTDVVPVVQSFVDGLTGQDGLKDGLTESQITAIEWGKKIRGIIATVIELKDELIAVAAVIGTLFVVSKISAAVVATIALINTLIKAYNLLKASAIVAGVATAFALNPLLGVGAVALAAGVLAGANALARSGDISGADTFAESGTPSFISGKKLGNGSSTLSNGEVLGTIINNPIVIDPSATDSTAATLAAAQLAAAETAKAAALAAKLLAESEAKLVPGAFDSGLSGTQSLAAIEAISNRPFAFGTSGVNTNSLAGIMAASGQPTVVINVNSPSIIDEEGFTRALNNAQNNSFFRGTGGATNLVGI